MRVEAGQHAVDRLGDQLLVFHRLDVVLLDRTEDFSECAQLLDRYGVPVREWAIWGRPELFSLLIAEPSGSGDASWEVMARVVDEVLSLAQDMGGTLEYCHGVGLKLGHLMERELGVGMKAVREIKAALDPHGIMNPGKLGV